MSEDSIFDIWIKGRFEYAIPTLKITLGAFISMIIMNYFDTSFLYKEMSFPNPLTYGHILGYLVAASGLILAMYYAGDFWINISAWGIKKIWNWRSSPTSEAEEL